MKTLKRLFHFLGGLYFALTLIALAACTVVLGTVLESLTDSHQLAAQWTYEHPLFLLLLSLFFINILFSALRRWPFKKQHIPFLLTHLGLLMILSGTMIKNRLGLQGHLSVWEGSSNQHLLIPHSHALYLEAKDSATKGIIPLESFHRRVYYPPEFPSLKCKVISYAPHVKEHLETWIKGSQAYIAGLSPFPVHSWKAGDPFPHGTRSPLPVRSSQMWEIVALLTPHLQEALENTYLQQLTLHLTSKEVPQQTIDIPLQTALRSPFTFASREWTASLHLTSFLEEENHSTLHLQWHSHDSPLAETILIPLQGQEALVSKTAASQWTSPAFTVDLIRPHPLLCFLTDEQRDLWLCACDAHGRLHTENFNPSQLHTLMAYDQGFQGYAVQASIPFSTSSASREDKEKADADALTQQLRQVLEQHPPLAPPLDLLEKACQQAQVDFLPTWMQFLVAWDACPTLVFHPTHSLPLEIDHALRSLDWKTISLSDQQAILWTHHLFSQLDASRQQGIEPLMVLEQNRWPLLKELKQAIHASESSSPSNALAQQILSLIAYLPPLEFPTTLSQKEQASLLAAYFNVYGIDYRSLQSSPQTPQEQSELQSAIALETPLTSYILPDTPPLKPEDCCPGIVLEVQQGTHKQTVALAYDSNGVGLKWPLLNGEYVARFQPKLQELPYRVRLRQARQIPYPHSSQIYSYECDVWITERDQEPLAHTLSMNRVYETWEGYRFYLAGVGTSADQSLKRVQLVVNYDPVKYLLTYPGAFLVFLGILMLFWLYPHKSTK